MNITEGRNYVDIFLEFLIAIDHCWSSIKTPSIIFENGIKELQIMPATKDNLLEFRDRKYVIGQGRMGMKRHCENALAVAKFLKEQDKVAWVHYADLEEDKYHDLAKKYMPNGTCGVLAFSIKGGRDASIAFMDKLKLVSIVTHVADAKTCLLHPASHTHRQLTDKQLEEA